MENFSGLFMLAIIGALAYYAEGYYRLKAKVKQHIPYIMDCSTAELKKITLQYLSRFDNYEQLAADKGKPEIVPYFTDAFNQLEVYYRYLKQNMPISYTGRNAMRLLIKDTEKFAQVQLH